VSLVSVLGNMPHELRVRGSKQERIALAKEEEEEESLVAELRW
jgi:hypothetical protein